MLGVSVCTQVLDKEKGNNTMYTIQNAARALGVAVPTVRRWMERENIEIKKIETDRKRIYLAYSDVLALADKHKPQMVNVINQEKSSQETTGLYSMEDIARLLGVPYDRVRKWIEKSDIEKKMITTDRKRAYISYSDLVTLAEKYNRPIAYDKAVNEQDSDTQENDHLQEEKLYTLADAALFLGVTDDTISRWLSLYNVERRTMEADRRRVYLAYSDIIMLANKRKREGVYPVDIVTNIREIRSRLEKIEAGILNLEKYIKRSVYMGR